MMPAPPCLPPRDVTRPKPLRLPGCDVVSRNERL